MLLGEQVLPVARALLAGRDVVTLLRTDCTEHVLGMLPGHKPAPPRDDNG
jgi:xanthosine utilization system XapX-like protein